MAGVNPYIEQSKTEKPTRKFTVTFLPAGKTFGWTLPRYRITVPGFPEAFLILPRGPGLRSTMPVGEWQPVQPAMSL